MFKKIPHGVKVRVRGNDSIGYVAEYAIGCVRFLPFMDTWSIIKYYDAGRFRDTFPSFESAQTAAMEQYNSWMSYYEHKLEQEKIKKLLKKSRPIWEHP